MVEFNAKDLERNPAGFTIAPIKFNGQESNLYFGYYTVGSEQYGNLRYSWYIGFYVDLTSGAGQVFLRFEVTTDIDPKTLDGTQFEFADSEDDKKTLYVGADGSMIIFDGRFNDTFNGMLYIDSQGAVKIGTWSESGGHYVFDELDGEFTVTFDANSDDGTYTVV